ncbi:MAG: DUF2752 domain-containing protein [Blautia sp.]
MGQSKKQWDRNQKVLYIAGWAALGAAFIFYAVWMRLGQSVQVPCLFYRITGFYCPGCGGTRAFSQLLQGHFLRSLWYHPAVLYGAVLYLCFMVSNTAELVTGGRLSIGMRYRNWYVYLLLILMLLHMVVKNVMFHGFGIPML